MTKNSDYQPVLLSAEEYTKVKEVFLLTFDTLFSSYVTEGDITELTEHLAVIHSEARVYKALTQQVINYHQTLMFTRDPIRDFHLELIARFGIEISTIAENAFDRLIDTLVVGQCSGQSVVRDNDYVQMSININQEDAYTQYKNHTWLVTLQLLTMWFKKTAVGSSLK